MLDLALDGPPVPTQAMSEALNVQSAALSSSDGNLLLQEAEHRFRNLLSIVSAVTRRTLMENQTDPRVVDHLLSRFDALSDSGSVFSDDDIVEGDFVTVVEEELEPFLHQGDDRVLIRAHPLRLSRQLRRAIRLVVHELATNSIKHGALSQETGMITITCREDFGPTRDVRFEWIETSVTNTSRIVSSGFGFQMMRRVLLGIGAGDPLIKQEDGAFHFGFVFSRGEGGPAKHSPSRIPKAFPIADPLVGLS